MAHSARRPQAPRSLHGGGLKLPSLPRFHPANFPSQTSSLASTPSPGLNSPQPPVSPRSQQRQYSEAQRQLYAYHRDLFSPGGSSKSYGKASTSSSAARPSSPRLIPAGSPGPVTPLELENESAGYLVAGAAIGASEHAQRELVEKLIREEAVRRGELSQKRTSVGGY